MTARTDQPRNSGPTKTLQLSQLQASLTSNLPPGQRNQQPPAYLNDMSPSGGNLAVTTDGGSYNKLRRPDDFLASLTSKPPPRDRPISATSPPDSNKRKHEEADISDAAPEEEPCSKRPREDRTPKAVRPLAANNRRMFRPIRENGMQSMFPGMDEDNLSDDDTAEALAYLRGVRSVLFHLPSRLLLAPYLLSPHIAMLTF